MNIVFLLAPFSVLLALIGLAAFWWTVDNGQYDDPLGDASRILIEDADTPGEPAPESPPDAHDRLSRIP